MKTRLLSERKCYNYGTALAVAIFIFDLTHPLGVAGSMPYIALPLLGMLARSNRAVIKLAVLGTVLSVAGAFLSTSGAALYIVCINRGLSCTLIWIVADVALRHLAVGNELRTSLRKAAFRDPLTGLYNRRYTFKIFDNELNRYHRYGDPFSLILIDADYFKRVNDEFGHCAGMSPCKLSPILASTRFATVTWSVGSAAKSSSFCCHIPLRTTQRLLPSASAVLLMSARLSGRVKNCR